MFRSVTKQEAPRLTRRELAIAAVITSAIRNARNNLDLDELTSALNRLDVDEVNRIVNQLSISPEELRIVTELAGQVRASMQDSIGNIQAVLRGQNALLPQGVQTLNPQFLADLPASQLPSYLRPVQTSFSFNYTDPRILYWANTRAGSLITAVDESTRLAIRQIIGRSFSDQITVAETAKILRDVVGLHPRWANAVYDFRVRTIDGLLDEGISLARATSRADILTNRYRTKLTNARARMIARTEIQLAQNQGRYLGWQQANDRGLLDGDSTKMWITAYRDVCDECLDLNGQIVPWNGAFTNGDIMPPAHPNCRCTAVVIPPDRGTFSPSDAIAEGFAEGEEFEE